MRKGDTTKRCAFCGETKPLTAFRKKYDSLGNIMRVSAYCFPCVPLYRADLAARKRRAASA